MWTPHVKPSTISETRLEVWLIATLTSQGQSADVNRTTPTCIFWHFCILVISVKWTVVQHLLAPTPTRSTQFQSRLFVVHQNKSTQRHRNAAEYKCSQQQVLTRSNDSLLELESWQLDFFSWTGRNISLLIQVISSVWGSKWVLKPFTCQWVSDFGTTKILFYFCRGNHGLVKQIQWRIWNDSGSNSVSESSFYCFNFDVWVSFSS